MPRLLFFPEPLPDEDFRSIVYRYHIMSSNSTFQESKKQIFGTRSDKNPMFPMKLESLYSRLPIGFSFQLNIFVDQHTWAKLVFPFFTKVNQEKMLMLMKFGDELGQTNIFHIPGLFSKQVKYCPECLEVDEKRFGICYTHRIHQLSILDHCPIHYSKLIWACPQCNFPLSKEYAAKLISQPKCSNCKSTMKTSQIDKTNFIIMFKDKLVQILCQLRDSSEQLSADIIQQKMMMKLWELKFIHYRGRVMKSEFLKEIASKFSVEQLEIIGIEKTKLLARHFIARFLTLDDMKRNVLFYTLLIQYLFHSVDEFLNYNYPIAVSIPFGNGPWECNNTLCEGYKQKVINHCSRKSKGSQGSTVSVEFVCPHCGYTYSRLWKPGWDEVRKPLVVSMGHLWQEKVKNLYFAGHTIYQIQKKTGFSKEALTTYIKRLSLKSGAPLGVDIPYDTSLAMREVAAAALVDNRQLFRNVLMESAREKGVTKRSTMLRLYPREYKWLHRYDSDWLDRHFPRHNNYINKIDLTDLDIVLAQKIQQVAAELKQEYSCRIRKHTILNRLSSLEKTRLLKMKERLPRSIIVLESSIEDIESYLIRRLYWKYKILKMKGCKNITYKNIAGYSKQYAQCVGEIRNKIEILLEQLNCENN
ncbi:TnsD family Tn7-like transposition protein [Paenibacillus popilliae]|uniref:TniQ protein n=1 Tax=Paenibacillus popilliae TaxID=78057 RepID=A0ABY3AHB2_PAEPP|nr:TnsD family Tn7-like transposition protein [Paenibacillus sp. SDF0028]TQR40166.1 hypothetical protein C7Y44_28175 [Paenibacillus sp. SDF0028]